MTESEEPESIWDGHRVEQWTLIKFVRALAEELHDESKRSEAVAFDLKAQADQSDGEVAVDISAGMVTFGICALVLRQIGNAITTAAKKTLLA